MNEITCSILHDLTGCKDMHTSSSLVVWVWSVISVLGSMEYIFTFRLSFSQAFTWSVIFSGNLEIWGIFFYETLDLV